MKKIIPQKLQKGHTICTVAPSRSLGRFQEQSNMTREVLKEIIQSKPELKNIPIIANADFGPNQSLLFLSVGE